MLYPKYCDNDSLHGDSYETLIYAVSFRGKKKKRILIEAGSEWQVKGLRKSAPP